MKHLLLALMSLSLMACASKRATSAQLNCEKMHDDSRVRIGELQKVFAAYQEVNYDLAARLSPAFKVEVDQLNTRVRHQKQKCWKSDERPIDHEMALLKDETLKIYGEIDQNPLVTDKNRRTIASRPKAKAATVAREETPYIFNDKPDSMVFPRKEAAAAKVEEKSEGIEDMSASPQAADFD